MRIVRKDSTEIFLVGPVVKLDGFTAFQSALLTSASAAVAFLHDTAAGVDISSYTWQTASVGGTVIPGYYHLTLTSAITSVPGPAAIIIQNSTDYLPVKIEYQVLGTQPFDAIYGSAPNILTSLDIGQLYESTVDTVVTSVSFDMADAIVTDDNWIGQTCSIYDATTGDSFVTWVADVDQANNRIIIATGTNAPTSPFVITSADTIRVESRVHPMYALNTYDPPTRAELNTDTQAVNVSTIAGVTIIGSGSADSLFRTAGT